MAIETIKTRIKNKVDTYENWVDATGKLLDGEIALVRVPTGETYTNPVTKQNEPAWELLMKVGDGQKTFAELPWLSAKASDVYDWAKKGTAGEIPVTVNDTASTLGAYLTKVDTNASNISTVSDKVDVTKVSTAISSAISTLKTNLKHSGTQGTNQIVKAVTQANGAVTVTYGTITEAELPNISASKVKVDSSTTLESKLSTMDAAIAANKELAEHGHPYLPDTTLYALGVSKGGPAVSANKVNTAVTFNDGGDGVGSGATFDGSAAKTISYNTIGAASREAVFGTNGLESKVTKNAGDIAELRDTIARGVNFRGEVTSAPTGSTYTLKGESSAKNALVGDMVICGEKEYIYTAANTWKELGDLGRVTTLETWRGKLQIADSAVANQFVTEVDIATDGTVTVGRARPSASNISYNNSDVGTKLDKIDAALANKSSSDHTHPSYENQNAFSTIKIGNTTVAADTTTDTVEFVGSNITITPDAANDKITFTVADGSTSAKGIVQLDNTVTSTSTSLAATANAVKTAYDKAAEAAADAASRAPSNHGHGNITKDGTITSTAVTAATGVLVYDSSNKIQRATAAQTRAIIGAGTSNLAIGTSATTAAAGNHSHAAHEERTSAIEGNYVRFNSSDNKLYVGKNGVNEIIFDCGGAK